jgi:hypothetical protein
MRHGSDRVVPVGAANVNNFHTACSTYVLICRGQGRVRGHDKILAMPRGQSAADDGG